jgi:peptidoglycan hydrolase-like protein with peptidoglycan-binding domain
VANLQSYLRRLAYWEAEIPQPPVDGIFESRTEEALRAYQRTRAIPVTGVADFDTWERLYADYRASLAAHSPPRQASIFPIYPENYVITEGSTGFAVTALQYMLSELQHSYAYLEALAVSGVYDAQTADAVTRFQRENGILGEAGVGLATWNAIADQYNTLYRTVNEE